MLTWTRFPGACRDTAVQRQRLARRYVASRGTSCLESYLTRAVCWTGYPPLPIRGPAKDIRQQIAQVAQQVGDGPRRTSYSASPEYTTTGTAAQGFTPSTAAQGFTPTTAAQGFTPTIASGHAAPEFPTAARGPAALEEQLYGDPGPGAHPQNLLHLSHSLQLSDADVTTMIQLEDGTLFYWSEAGEFGLATADGEYHR